MKFVIRALTGLVWFSITMGMIGYGGWRLYTAAQDNGSRRPAQARERSFSVEVARLESSVVTPVITAYGQVRAWRMLEVRAAGKGPIVELSRNFRDGALVAKDELLFRIDPVEYQRRVGDAKAALAQARADAADARAGLELASAETLSAREQFELKISELQRSTRLKAEGFVARTALDTAKHAVAAAEQSLHSRRKAELTARTRIQSSALAVERAQISLADVEKALGDAQYRAPFSGALTNVVVTLGKRVSQNEMLGVLIDPASLEVSFRVNDEEFGRLLDAGRDGALKPLPLKITLDLGARSVEVEGRLERAAAVTDLAKGGRVLFATISPQSGNMLRPGDFVSVAISEEPLSNVAAIPASAATDDGRIFVLSEGDRLLEVKTRVVRRQGNEIILADAPIGREFVKARQAFLAAGVQVRPRRVGAPALEAPATLALSDKRRAALIDFIKGSGRMPDEVKARILARLARAEVPKELVERFEARMAAGAGLAVGKNVASGTAGAPTAHANTTGDETIVLSAEKRAAYIAYVKSQGRMSDPARERLLGVLQNSAVPRSVIERLEERMRSAH